MPLRSPSIAIGSAIVALALATTACTSSGNSTSATSSQPAGGMSSSSSSMSMAPSTGSSSSATTATDASATPAATLRSGLDQLFREHVNLTGFVVQTAVTTGLTSKNTAMALKALDDNTVALGSAVGSVYGGAAKTAFIKMWRAHIGFFVNYTKGLATKDQALVAKSQKQLAGYKADFAKFLGQATGLPANAVAADLQGHITTLETAIQAIVTKSPSAGPKVLMAESHMAGTGAVLASAIAKQKHLS